MIGYGKMGKAIESLAGQKGHEIILKINSSNLNELTAANISNADLAFEFSVPEAAYQNIITCFEADIPVVSGTTGWIDQLETIKTKCIQENQTLFYAPNFSIGVNIFFELNDQLASLMNKQAQYSITVEETHHTSKKDAPSGTAINLANDIINNITVKKRWVNEMNNNPEDLNIISHRKNNVTGTHNVKYNSGVDEVEIKHTAFSREGFAQGALLAAEWIAGKKGFYQMKDLLKLNSD